MDWTFKSVAPALFSARRDYISTDLWIMSSEPPNADKEDKGFSSAESGKVLQNPQPPRNQEHVIPSTKPAEQEGRTAESTPPLPDSGVRPREE
jgi:hypothetical protein